MIFMQCIVVTELLASYKAVWLPLLTLHENLQNKLTMRSVPVPLLCMLVMRNIHPVLQGGSGSETNPFSMCGGCIPFLHVWVM